MHLGAGAGAGAGEWKLCGGRKPKREWKLGTVYFVPRIPSLCIYFKIQKI